MVTETYYCMMYSATWHLSAVVVAHLLVGETVSVYTSSQLTEGALAVYTLEALQTLARVVVAGRRIWNSTFTQLQLVADLRVVCRKRGAGDVPGGVSRQTARPGAHGSCRQASRRERPHVGPVHSAGQEHENPPGKSVQRPPCSQGSATHSSTSSSQYRPVNPAGH